MTDLRVNTMQPHGPHVVRLPPTESVIVCLPPTKYLGLRAEPHEIVPYYQAHEFTTAQLVDHDDDTLVYRSAKDIPAKHADCNVGFDARRSPLTGTLEIVALVLHGDFPPVEQRLEVAMMRADLDDIRAQIEEMDW